jgi:hypothetical protein
MWDLWALGVMSVEMLTGTRPLGAVPAPVIRPPSALAREDEQRIATFGAVALAEDVALRPRTARELHDSLALALQQRTN